MGKKAVPFFLMTDVGRARLDMTGVEFIAE